MFQGEGAPNRTPLASQQGFPPSGAFTAPYHRAPHGSAPVPLRVPPPVRFRMLCLRLAQPRNPPRLGGFLLALLLRVLVMTRRGLSQRPVSLRVSPLPVTLRLRVWLTSSMRSALPRARSLTLRLLVASLRLGSASLRLRPRGSASACTPAWRWCWRRLLPGRSLWLVVPGRFPRVIPARARAYAMADDAIFTSSQPVNSTFSQLVGSRSLGACRWGSITFSEMERLERLFQGQLEVTSSFLWLMSGILAMLKRDGFQPSDPALFNSALSAVSATLSRQARTAAAGSTFVRAKHRESLLAHTTLPVPESQKRDLTVAPGSSSGLFDSELLSEVVAQVHSSSQISSNLALSRSLRRGRSTPSSSSSPPLTGPRLPSFARGRPSGKRSSSSSRAGSRKRFRGGKGGLLLLGLRVSGGRSHHLSGPFLAVVCPSTGKPTDPALFNAALASASATLSQQARSSESCSTFMRAKRRDSYLAHTAIPVPETQRRSLTVSPGSETLLFDEEMLGVVVSQVQQLSLISSNLAMSRSLARG